MLPGGNDSSAKGVWVNQDCCTNTSWDAAQWQFRSLATPQATQDLIDPVLTPKEIYLESGSVTEASNSADPFMQRLIARGSCNA
jgi:hypothetical protein